MSKLSVSKANVLSVLKWIFKALIVIVAIHILLLLEVTWIAHVTEDSTRTEQPKATFKELFTGKHVNKVSIAKACSINGGCVDNVALFASDINAYSVGLFNKFIEENPSIKMVCLLSGGGEIQQASEMASTITKKGLTTCMADYYRLADNIVIKSSYCESACNQILLSSHERKQIGSLVSFSGHAAGNTATLSFGIGAREWRFKTSESGENKGFEDVINKADTLDRLKHLEYLELVKNINHLQDMKDLTPQELLKYRIFTHQCDGHGSCTKLDVEQALP